MWDFLNKLYDNLGFSALLGVAFVFIAIWFSAHIIAPPCEKISIFFGLIEYKKAGCKKNDDPLKNTIHPSESYPSIQSLTNKVWQFSGGSDGSMIIAERIRLLPGGGIDGYYHQNEARWGVEHGILVFYTEWGEPSCRFTSVHRKDGRIILSGKFLLEPGLIEVLTEVP
jgi:hypothetical protein